MEIDKEKRLPVGYKSWLQIARRIDSQDHLHVDWSRNEQRFHIVSYLHGRDHFECDVLTLKVRAFDELIEIIPEKDKLRSMIIKYMNLSRMVEEDDLYLLLKRLIEIQ